MKRLATACAAALASALSASAAEVVVYSPETSGGFTLKTPGKTLAYPAAWTGHRAVCKTTDTDTNAVFEAWTGSGDFAPATMAYGTSAGRTAPAVELAPHSAVMPRINVRTAETDRAPTYANYCTNLFRIVNEAKITDEQRKLLLDRLEWASKHLWTDAALDAQGLLSAEDVRVRIVRWLADSNPTYRLGFKPEVIVDRKMRLSERAFLTEGDVLADGALDLDWDKLYTDVVTNWWTQLYETPVTNMAYLVVIGDGKTYWSDDADTNSVPVILDRVIERRFGYSRIAPTPVSATFDGDCARFRFRIDGEGAVESFWGTSYTAFQVFARQSGASTNDWASGIMRLPAKDPRKDVYQYATDDAALAALLSSGKTYDWLCAIYNAKYSNTPDSVTNGLSSAGIDVDAD